MSQEIGFCCGKLHRLAGVRSLSKLLVRYASVIELFARPLPESCAFEMRFSTPRMPQFSASLTTPVLRFVKKPGPLSAAAAILLQGDILVGNCDVAKFLLLSIDVVFIDSRPLAPDSQLILAFPLDREAVTGSIEDDSVTVICVSQLSRCE